MSKYAPHHRSAPRATSTTVCQKCLQTGHFTYECKSPRPYVSRPSRTQMMENPRLLAKLKTDGKPSVEVPEEFTKKSGTANRILEAKEKERAKEKLSTASSASTSDARKKARRYESRLFASCTSTNHSLSQV
ncbi:zinc knuckle-domain-containing protein [Pisolithus sp. B1]|nr:zinc knuckle-domain-containing protein [Pisolithus sp. B1]